MREPSQTYVDTSQLTNRSIRADRGEHNSLDDVFVPPQLRFRLS